MSDDDREALAIGILARWDTDNVARTMHGYALAAADVALTYLPPDAAARTPAPAPPGGDDGAAAAGQRLADLLRELQVWDQEGNGPWSRGMRARVAGARVLAERLVVPALAAAGTDETGGDDQ